MSEEQTEGVKATADDVEAGSADTSESGIQEQPEVEEEKQPESWFITGANGNLGQRLIRRLLTEGAMITAVVRSGIAERELTRVFSATSQLRIEVIDYAETMLLAQAAYGAQYAVHLVGILKSSKNATYATAHESSCASLSRALKDTSVEHITYLSILGAKPESNNACLASKGRAERILYRCPIPACTLRVPMVIGERDYAIKMLTQRANVVVHDRQGIGRCVVDQRHGGEVCTVVEERGFEARVDRVSIVVVDKVFLQSGQCLTNLQRRQRSRHVA